MHDKRARFAKIQYLPRTARWWIPELAQRDITLRVAGVHVRAMRRETIDSSFHHRANRVIDDERQVHELVVDRLVTSAERRRRHARRCGLALRAAARPTVTPSSPPCAGRLPPRPSSPPSSWLAPVALVAGAFIGVRGVDCALVVFRASRTDLRLAGPRTGARSTKTQPTLAHRLAADQASFVEEPWVVTVELLERVVGEHIGVGTVCDLQDERVATADRTSRWCHQFAVQHCFFVRSALPSHRCDDRTLRRRQQSRAHSRTPRATRALLRRVVANSATARPSVAMFEPSTTTWFDAISRVSQAKDCASRADDAHRRTISRDASVIAHVACTRRTLANVHDDTSAEVTDLLQQLIRNECVNDGTATSGNESRSVDTLSQYLGSSRTRHRDVRTASRVERVLSRASKALMRTRRRCC